MLLIIESIIPINVVSKVLSHFARFSILTCFYARFKFSRLLDSLGIKQPEWKELQVTYYMYYYIHYILH
jgi:hypothetical protein